MITHEEKSTHAQQEQTLFDLRVLLSELHVKTGVNAEIAEKDAEFAEEAFASIRDTGDSIRDSLFSPTSSPIE